MTWFRERASAVCIDKRRVFILSHLSRLAVLLACAAVLPALAAPSPKETRAAAAALKEQAATAAVEAAEAAVQGDLGRPYDLPVASRSRIHACGVEWQTMKLSGAAADRIWRVFASVCFARPDDKPVDANPR